MEDSEINVRIFLIFNTNIDFYICINYQYYICVLNISKLYSYIDCFDNYNFIKSICNINFRIMLTEFEKKEKKNIQT